MLHAVNLGLYRLFRAQTRLRRTFPYPHLTTGDSICQIQKDFQAHGWAVVRIRLDTNQTT